MAGRIRSFKPEMLDLEPAAALSSDAWRVWVSMMLLADDLGNLRAAPKLLAAHIFHDTARVATIEDALDELTRMPDACRVTLYRSGAELFAHLGGFMDGQCQAIAQFPSKVGKNPARVPQPNSPGAEPVSTVPRTCTSSRNRTEQNRTKKNRTVPKSSDRFQKELRVRTHSPYPDHYHDPYQEDLSPEVVAALPSIARDRGDDGAGHTDKIPELHSDPPTARSVPPPERDAVAVAQNRTAIASTALAPTANPSDHQIPVLKPNVVSSPKVHRPKFEPQRDDSGRDIIDPATGNLLVLDVNALTAEQVQAERARCLSAVERARPPSQPKPQSPPTPRPSPVATPQPTMATPEDPEAAMRQMLAQAPKPICLLSERSAMRLASVLVGTSVRATDIPPALQAAALKLDRKFERLGPDSLEHELEELHRFVAGFVGKAHMFRGQKTPEAQPTEAGDKLLGSFRAAYKKQFGTEYHAAEDDAAHATTICGLLGQRLRSEATSEADVQKMRKRMVQRLFEQWFADSFAARCGYAVRHLARLLANEPNRFSFAAQPSAYGASAMPAEIPDQIKAMVNRVGVDSTAKEQDHESNTSQKTVG